MVTVSVEVLKRVYRVPDPLCTPYTAQGHVSAGDALGHGHDVRLDIEMLHCKPLSGPTKTTDHFVDNEQHSVAVTYLANYLPVLLRRPVSSESLLDRLPDKS